MTINYTDEMKLPLQEDGSYNWGAVLNGVFELLDKGHELTFTFGETVTAGAVVAIKIGLMPQNQRSLACHKGIQRGILENESQP